MLALISRSCMHLHVLVSCAVLLSTILNLLVTVGFDNFGGDKLHSYSYIGDDYPAEWSIKDTPHVVLTVEETVHYQIDGLDAREEWASSSPINLGYIKLGSEHRAFAVSMFHQLHCIRLMRSALAGDYRRSTQGHFEHCLNYLRQMILCNPNLTLEPANVLSRNLDVERTGATHVCMDWHQVYVEMSNNWDDWVHVRGAFLNST